MFDTWLNIRLHLVLSAEFDKFLSISIHFTESVKVAMSLWATSDITAMPETGDDDDGGDAYWEFNFVDKCIEWMRSVMCDDYN